MAVLFREMRDGFRLFLMFRAGLRWRHGPRQGGATGRKMEILPFPPFSLPAACARHDSCASLAHSSRTGRFFTASRKRFFQTTKPLILLAETIVKYINVKYVFLTGGSKKGSFFGKDPRRKMVPWPGCKSALKRPARRVPCQAAGLPGLKQRLGPSKLAPPSLWLSMRVAPICNSDLIRSHVKEKQRHWASWPAC